MSYDAVIVLAHKMGPDGILSRESRARANYAAQIIDDLNIPKIITSGWAYRDDCTTAIGDAFECYLTSVGVESNRIITDINARDTVGDAVFTKINVAEPNGYHRICVVTSDYHVPRTWRIFNFVYGSSFKLTVIGVYTEPSKARMESEVRSRCAFEETFGAAIAGHSDNILGILRSHHPFYNGDIYPEI